MTGLLASVCDAGEAGLILEGGADIIDLKDPSVGALGALDIGVMTDIVALVNGRVPVSATIGDIPFTAAAIRPRIEAVAATGVDFVKVGVFGDVRDTGVLEMLRALSQAGLRMVLVFFAEDVPGHTDFTALSRHGIHGVMLDTRDKSSGSLRSKLSHRQLESFVSGARETGLLCGLAGSLCADDIPALLPLRPDYLGFRSALCRGSNREGEVDAAAAGAVRLMLSAPVPGEQLNPGIMQWR
ncbi:MAG: (5-formylfuran-3-yl)methyl phosphate synthase [Gammaproteobacteria bacterium]